ncbi:MAG: hypothetical protein O8C60_05835 [Candidatus Methanoperedens sp.]|nr:hypothetical protein [Candidatus Methanoperedens sp.]
MRISSIMIALLILTVVTLSGCLSESEKLPVDPLEPRENSDEGVKITVTYLPDIT